MNFPNYFADAESSFDEAKFVIFGAPYDKTSSFRLGADKGPQEIRKASWNFETFNLKTGMDLQDIRFHDYGDLEVKNDAPQVMAKKVKEFTSDLLKKDKFPIALGGEHSIATGIVQAFPKDTAVLSLDAHIDFRQQYEDEPYNHACVLRRISEHISTDNIAVLGIRSAEKEEFEYAQKSKLFSVDSFTIKDKGMKHALDETKHHLQDKQIYFTLDIDVIDPAYAPATSTPEPFGLTPFDVLDCIDCFASQLVGFDVVEVCPPYDKGETAILAAKIVRHVIGQVWATQL